MLDNISQVFVKGGWVTYVLTAVSVLLWYSVLLRTHALTRVGATALKATQGEPNALSNFLRESQKIPYDPNRMQHLAQQALASFGYMRSFIRTLVAVAPLLGLLGTVIGMVEMFGSMHGSHLRKNEATVAGGISTALITTQFGLIISAPGLVASHLLNRLQERRARDVRKLLQMLEEASS